MSDRAARAEHVRDHMERGELICRCHRQVSVPLIGPAIAEALVQMAAEFERVMDALVAAFAPGNDPDEPLWLDASRPDPNAEVWRP